MKHFKNVNISMKNYLMITMVTEEGRRKTEEVYCEKNEVFLCVWLWSFSCENGKRFQSCVL